MIEFMRLWGGPSRPSPPTEHLTLAQLRAAVEFPTLAERPYVAANFVASADGRATFHGRSAPLSDAGDRAMFHALRERVDAVLAGTGTLRVERYGRLVGDGEARERRRRSGLEPEPIACTITRTGSLPTDIPLLAEPDQGRVIVFAGAPTGNTGGHVETVRIDPDELTLLTVMRRLRADYGVTTLLCEGGPTLFGSLLKERLVDELFLSLSPKLVGGGRAPTISRGSELSEPEELQPVWALARERMVFLRYRVCAGGPRAEDRRPAQ